MRSDTLSLDEPITGCELKDEEKTDAADANADWNFSIGEDPSRLENCFVKKDALFFFIPLILDKSIDGLFNWEDKSSVFSLSTEKVFVSFLLEKEHVVLEEEGLLEAPPTESVPFVTSISVEFWLFVFLLFSLFFWLFLSLDDEPWSELSMT